MRGAEVLIQADQFGGLFRGGTRIVGAKQCISEILSGVGMGWKQLRRLLECLDRLGRLT
jgi:hypothetical protein